MIITGAYVRTVSSALAEPYTIAYETITDVVNHFLVLEADSGLNGIGCAAPAPEVTGESESASLEALNRFCVEVRGRSTNSFPEMASNRPSARAAVDLALNDLRARARNTNIAGLYGSAKTIDTGRVTSITVGIMGVKATVEKASSFVSAGFSFLKIKGGHDVALDIERLQELRSQFGSAVRIALDANQGYSLEDVQKLDREASNLKLEYLEQPTPKTNLNLMAKATFSSSIPVMADESIQTPEDARMIAKMSAAKLINIKVQKVGGLQVAHEIDAIARDAGMPTMLGCMDESALSIAAALHFGATHSNVLYYDLDGHLDLVEDPFESLVDCRNGELKPARGLGLGWTTIPEFLRD